MTGVNHTSAGSEQPRGMEPILNSLMQATLDVTTTSRPALRKRFEEILRGQVRDPAQAAPNPTDHDVDAAYQKGSLDTLEGLKERIADLQYEAGMYQSLYEHAIGQRISADSENAPYYHAWLEMIDHCNKLKEENYRLRNALPQTPSEREIALAIFTRRSGLHPKRAAEIFEEPPPRDVDVINALLDAEAVCSLSRPQHSTGEA
jgi:hypothetical protein